MALGQVVHDVIDSLSTLPTEDRLKISLLKKLDTEWEKISGERGGFTSKEQEAEYKQKGQTMLQRIMDNPGPITQKAIKIKQELPHYYISEEENIILCGKVDWLSFVEETDSVHVVDFKTGKNKEHDDSLQLPIYCLLVENTQSRHVSAASYWYLLTDDSPTLVNLPDLKASEDQVLSVAKRMKLARQLDHFKCPQNGCRYCVPLEEISKGKGKLVGVSNYNQDIYVI